MSILIRRQPFVLLSCKTCGLHLINNIENSKRVYYAERDRTGNRPPEPCSWKSENFEPKFPLTKVPPPYPVEIVKNKKHSPIFENDEDAAGERGEELSALVKVT